MSLWGARVLAIDDDLDTLDVIESALQLSGAEVITVGAPGAALATIMGVVPDVLLVDIAPPDEEGLSLMRQVRTLPPEKGGRIPSVAVSALPPSQARLEECRRCGFQRHLAKPFHPAELVAVVEELKGQTVERRRQVLARPDWPEEAARDRRFPGYQRGREASSDSASSRPSGLAK